MNPATQTQIFDPLRQQFVQVDGGELSQATLLWQILIELRLLNEQLYEQGQGRFLSDSLGQIRATHLNDPGFSQQA